MDRLSVVVRVAICIRFGAESGGGGSLVEVAKPRICATLETLAYPLLLAKAITEI